MLYLQVYFTDVIVHVVDKRCISNWCTFSSRFWRGKSGTWMKVVEGPFLVEFVRCLGCALALLKKWGVSLCLHGDWIQSAVRSNQKVFQVLQF